jgi:hypothetical protein
MAVTSPAMTCAAHALLIAVNAAATRACDLVHGPSPGPAIEREHGA